MSTLQIDILNPKAAKWLRMLADLNLISIREEKGDVFMTAVGKLRTKAKRNVPSLEEITREVEAVRTERYGRSGK